MKERPQPSHERFQAELAELAVGALDGRTRALLLGHVGTCASCSAELSELTTAADALVHVAPEIDPPLGFESRVFERIRPDTDRPRRLGARRARRWNRAPMFAAAAAATVALAFGVGWAIHQPGAPGNGVSALPSPGEHAAEAQLVAGGQRLGLVSIYRGSPGWLQMTVDSRSRSGMVRCSVTTADGSTRIVGSFALVSGSGSWGVPLTVPAQTVTAVHLTTPSGHVLASAQFN